jgi:hypothetical protein
LIFWIVLVALYRFSYSSRLLTFGVGRIQNNLTSDTYCQETAQGVAPLGDFIIYKLF